MQIAEGTTINHIAHYHTMKQSQHSEDSAETRVITSAKANHELCVRRVIVVIIISCSNRSTVVEVVQIGRVATVTTAQEIF